MSFDTLAPHYGWMERVFAGGLMHRCRNRFLSRTLHCRHALLVGEGPGAFLASLLRINPRIQVTCVEQSAGMIRQMQRRLRAARLNPERVKFRQLDARHWSAAPDTFAPGTFDLVATNFFLDCFPAGDLPRLVRDLAAGTRPGALWLLADFCEPARGWRRWRARALLAGLYAFFRLTTRLPARRLTPPDAGLRQAGFHLRERQLYNFGFAHADLWERTTT